jgi:phage-related protein
MDKESMALAAKMDRIFEEIYSVNESIDDSSRQEMQRGFEDGINELFGGLGKFAAKTKKFFTGVKDKASDAYDKGKEAVSRAVDKTKDFYQKGKDMAGKAWDAMVEFKDKVVAKVKEGLAKAKEAIGNGWNSFRSAISNAYAKSIEAISSAWSKMKEKGAAFADAVSRIWGNIVDKTKEMISGIKEKFIAMKEKFSEWLSSSRGSLMKSVMNAKNSVIEGFSWLAGKASDAVKGIAKGAGAALAVAVFICTYPFIFAVKGLKAIPVAYEKAIDAVKGFIRSEIEEIKRAYQEEMAKESFGRIMTFQRFNG